MWSATVASLRAVKWGSYSQGCFQENYRLLMLSVFLWFVDFTSLFLALLPLVSPVIYAHCPLYKTEFWDQAAVLKSQKYVEGEKSPDVCLSACARSEKVTFLWFLFRPRHLYLQTSKSWGTKYFPLCWKTNQWIPVLCVGKYTSYWMICDVGSNSSLLSPRPWNTGNPLWSFCSAPSLLALHPTLMLEISPGDLQLTVGSNNCKHVICSEFYMFSKGVGCWGGGHSILVPAPTRELPPLLRWDSATHNGWKNLLGRLWEWEKFCYKQNASHAAYRNIF